MQDQNPLKQMHAAMAARLAAAAEGKLDLAEAVRDCCLDLPVNVPLAVAGHILIWVKGECDLEGGIYGNVCKTYPKNIMLIDNQLLDEPLVEDDCDDPVNRPVPALVRGPVTGWYIDGVLAEHSRLSRISYTNFYEYGYPELEHVPMPHAFSLCKLPALREVASALPRVMASWQKEHQEALENETVEISRLTTALQ